MNIKKILIIIGIIAIIIIIILLMIMPSRKQDDADVSLPSELSSQPAIKPILPVISSNTTTQDYNQTTQTQTNTIQDDIDDTSNNNRIADAPTPSPVPITPQIMQLPQVPELSDDSWDTQDFSGDSTPDIFQPSPPSPQPASPEEMPILVSPYPSSPDEMPSLFSGTQPIKVEVRTLLLGENFLNTFGDIPPSEYYNLGMIDRVSLMIALLVEERNALYRMPIVAMNIDRQCLLGPDRGYEQRLFSPYIRATGKYQRKADKNKQKAANTLMMYETIVSYMNQNIKNRMQTAGPNENDPGFFTRMKNTVDSVDDVNDQVVEVERTLRKLYNAQARLLEIERQYKANPSIENQNNIALQLVQLEQTGEIPPESALIEEHARLQLVLASEKNLKNEHQSCLTEVSRPEYHILRLADKMSLLYCPLEAVTFGYSGGLNVDQRSRVHSEIVSKWPPFIGSQTNLVSLKFDSPAGIVFGVPAKSEDGLIQFSRGEMKDIRYSKHKPIYIKLSDYELYINGVNDTVKAVFHRVKYPVSGVGDLENESDKFIKISCKSFYHSAINEYRPKVGVF